MKASYLILMLLVFVTTVFAQVSVCVTAQDTIKVSGSLGFSMIGNSNPSMDPILLGQRGVLNVTSTIGLVKTILEFGTIQMDGNVKTRLAQSSVNIGNVEINAGQGYIPGAERFLRSIVDDKSVMDNCSRPGGFYMGRILRCYLKWNQGPYFNITTTLMESAKPSVPGFRGTPRILVSTKTKISNLNLTYNVGGECYFKDSDKYNAIVAGFTLDDPDLLGFDTTCQFWKGRNASDFGLVTIPSGIAQKRISRSTGGSVQLTRSTITIGSGYVHVYSSQQELGSVYVQHNIKIWKSLQLTSEVGYFWGNYLAKDNLYVAMRTIARF